MTTEALATINTANINTTEDSSIDLSDLIRYRYKHNMSYQQIADKLGCHKSTVMRKLTKYISMLPEAEEVKAWEDNKSQFLSSLELKVYEKMSNEETLKSASFNNLAYGFQNICTQNRLEKGLATERLDIQTITGTIDDVRKERERLAKEMEG